MDKPSPYGHILQLWASNLPSQLRGHVAAAGSQRDQVAGSVPWAAARLPQDRVDLEFPVTVQHQMRSAGQRADDSAAAEVKHRGASVLCGGQLTQHFAGDAESVRRSIPSRRRRAEVSRGGVAAVPDRSDDA